MRNRASNKKQAEHSFQLNFVQLEGKLSIAYADEGPTDGQILLFVHGLAAGIPEWEKNIATLRSKFRCIAIDLPGHGFSSKGDLPYTIQFYTGVLNDFIDKLSLQEVILVGHSMGGQICMFSALQKPEVVKSLVLVAPTSFEKYTIWEKQVIASSMLGLVSTANVFSYLRFNFLIGCLNNFSVSQELREKMAFFEQDAIDAAMVACRSSLGVLNDPIYPFLDRIKQPVLVVYGTDDRVPFIRAFQRHTPDKFAADAVAVMPNARLLRIEEEGHFLNYTRPDVFNTAVENYIYELSIVDHSA